jgi:hypothetical protein
LLIAVARFNDTYIQWLRSKRELDSHGEQYKKRVRGSCVFRDAKCEPTSYSTIPDSMIMTNSGITSTTTVAGELKAPWIGGRFKPWVDFGADVFNAFNSHQWDAIPVYIRKRHLY